MTQLSAELLFDKLPKLQTFETNLWNAADKLRANAKLDPSAYKTPVLGLLFLRYASVKFDAATPQLMARYNEMPPPLRKPIAEVYQTECGFYMPETARYQYLLDLGKDKTAPQAVLDAVQAFDAANPTLAGILPQNDFLKIPDDTLRELLISLAQLEMNNGDQFGKIYEYFLAKFSSMQGQKGGEFYTPPSIVKLIVEVLEPHEGRFYDPACGSGGMFIQSANFIQRHAEGNNVSIFGQEKNPETAKIAKLNLSINGLRNEIKEVDNSLSKDTYHAEHFPVEGQFDYVMANPPFNVDEIKVSAVGDHPLFNAYGLPLSSGKSVKKGNEDGTFSNANYLWVSLFATALNDNGRAGFVMANSASDARGSEMEMRQRLVEEGMVDVMIAISSNFFYTVTLPVTLWFFDKAKANDPERQDKTLFIDARKVFYQTSRAHRAFTACQLQNLAAIVWLYRGETDKFLDLKNQYQQAIDLWHDGGVVENGDGILNTEGAVYASLLTYKTTCLTAITHFSQVTKDWLTGVKDNPQVIEKLGEATDFKANLADLTTIGNFDDKKQLNDLYKKAEDIATFIEKQLKPEGDKSFTKSDIKNALKNLADARKHYAFVADRIAFFEENLAWLNQRFPDNTFQDVEGLCKIATRADIAEQAFSLNPGRYVGVAIEDDGMTEADFKTFLTQQATTLQALYTTAKGLFEGIEKDMLLLTQPN